MEQWRSLLQGRPPQGQELAGLRLVLQQALRVRSRQGPRGELPSQMDGLLMEAYGQLQGQEHRLPFFGMLCREFGVQSERVVVVCGHGRCVGVGASVPCPASARGQAGRVRTASGRATGWVCVGGTHPLSMPGFETGQTRGRVPCEQVSR